MGGGEGVAETMHNKITFIFSNITKKFEVC